MNPKNFSVPLVAAAAVVFLAGCSSQPFETHYGQSATAIASHIKGCTEVTAGKVGAGAPDMSSTASCTLGERKVVIDTWSSAAAQAGVLTLAKSDSREMYYASGTGWIALVSIDRTFEYELTKDEDKLLFESGETHLPDAAGEQSPAKQVAADLNGTLVHVPR